MANFFDRLSMKLFFNHNRVLQKLNKSYQKAKEGDTKEPARFADIETAKLILFSDLHRGIRDGADDFNRCEKAYNAALGYYLESGYTLIVAGDAEELWECHPDEVIKAYQHSLSIEGLFHRDGRYARITGNHDDFWEDQNNVRKYLQQDIFGSQPLAINDHLRIILKHNDKELGELFIVHGHQGDMFSDGKSIVSYISRLFVRYIWRNFQRFTNIKWTTPAYNFELRGKQSIALYEWAEKQDNVVLIAGHTHIPVIYSKYHIDRLEKGIADLRIKLAGDPQNAQLITNIAEKRAEYEFIKSMLSEVLALEMKKPCYFNTGCCSYSDGDVTGIEISDGKIRLVRWPDDLGNPMPKILEEIDLLNIFKSA